MKVVFLLPLLSLGLAYRPLRPQPKRHYPKLSEEAVGQPLFLTPYIDAGDLETARNMARVDSSLLQGAPSDLESYSGFITADQANNGNMFFWFFPAAENPESAPVVIWLQGGPGGSSMFGLLKLHGPVLTGTDENGKFGVAENPYSWHRKHNMLYIDNPVGAGFSFSDKMPETQDEVSQNLYNMLQQWYKLFPMYQSNPFYPFGESYAGKFVPSIAKKIHKENQNPSNIRINLAGMGIGDGWMSPYHNARYGNFLYQVGLVDENVLSTCLEMETETQRLIQQGSWYSAWQSWNEEFSYFLTEMDYSYYYEITQAEYDPTEDDYETFCNMESTRRALHVGNLEYPNSGDVYFSMIYDFMRSSQHDIEFLLEHYKTLIYDGNFDIICNHSGVLDLINDMEWSGKNAYNRASRHPYRYGKELVGYLKKAENLNLLVVRNAGHMVPLSQPAWAQQMIEDFTSGNM